MGFSLERLLSVVVVVGFVAVLFGWAQTAAGLGPPPLGLDLFVPIPKENHPTETKIALGRQLFFDPILSSDKSKSCASCHRPEQGFADTEAFSQGVSGKQTLRNTPSLLNAAYGRALFWDGRTSTLEEQVLLPISNPNEMGAELETVLARLRLVAEYREQFEREFGIAPTEQTLAFALSSYVRTLRSGGSRFDRAAAGEAGVLTAEEKKGLEIFRGKANCVQCHFGALLSDELFHNTGVGWGSGDRGRFQVTGENEDQGKFNTPSLRNVGLTAPYMHNGSLASLEDVVDFYDRGGTPNPFLDPEIRPLRLSAEEKAQLVLYLLSLTGTE